MHKEGPVGRDAELADVDGFLSMVERGFTALALEGEPGIGKTTVWREAVRRADERGALTLTCRPAAAEAKLSYASVADLLSPIDDAALEGLPDPQRRALEVALLRTAPTGRPPDRRTVATALLSLLQRLAAERPVLVAVDDAHWLDPPSSEALAFAARRFAPEAVGLVCSYRPAANAPPVVGAVPEERRRSLVLGPLTLAALGRIIAARLGRSLPRPMLVRILEASGGNPFYALEIARLVVREGGTRAPTAALPVPDDLRALTAKRLRPLPARTRDALVRAAMLSAPDAQILDVEALAPAEEAGLISIDDRGRVEFSHPLFAAGIYASATTARRQELHRGLAGELADPEQRARHLAIGSPAPDERISRELDRAAASAASRGAPSAAAELVELAIEKTPPEDARNRVARLIVAARFQLDSGDLAASEALLKEALAAAPSDDLRAQAMQLLGHLHGRRSSFAEALEVSTAALESAGDDPSLRASIELDVAFCHASLGAFPGAEPHARTAIELAETIGADSMLSDALACLTVAEFLSGRGLDEERIARALALEDPDRSGSLVTHPRYIHGLLLLWTGNLAEARATLAKLRTELIGRGQESEVPLLSLYLTWTSLWGGDLESAARFAEEAREASSLLDDRMASALALSATALVHAHDGSTDLARNEAQESLAIFQQLQWAAGMIWPVWALGFVELSLGNYAAVDAVLGPLATGMIAMIANGDPVLGLFLPDEIEALITLGELDRAEALVGPFEERGRDLDRTWALATGGRCRGALLGARGDLDAAAAVLDEALAQHERLPLPFERARTLLVRGQVLRRRKQRREAGEALAEALDLFERIGTPLWAERARRELGRAGGRMRGDELTATEREVAELAASGLSNREIAERAFISVKAVEGNLTRVYRKLEINSRGGLARALAPAMAEPEAVEK